MSKSSRRIRITLAGLAAATVVLGSFVCTSKHGTVEPRPDANLLLITIDTLRADRVGAYGHKAAETPHLDRLARDGVLVERAMTPVPLTLPAHASIMTGTYPLEHGVRNNGNYFLPEGIPTLAGILKERGYVTAAFVAAFVLDARFGLGRGFDHYSDRVNEALPGSWYAERNADEVLEDFKPWFARHGADKFFAWIHFWDPHMEYDPPEPYRSRFADPYDGEVAYVDAAVGKILDLLQAAGIRDRTLIVVTSDHGEAFGEHGELGHSIFCYEENIRIPLILNLPGHLPSGKRTEGPASLVDVKPTVLELLGIEIPGHIQGISLIPEIGGRKPSPRDFYLESYYPMEDMGAAPVVGIVSGRYKFLDLPRPELYDLQADPAEMNNRVEKEPSRSRDMKAGLDRLIETFGSADRASTRTVSDEEWSRLASLGYLSAARRGEKQADRPDPKDVVKSAVEIVHGKRAVAAGRLNDAAESFKRSIEINPLNLTAYLLLSELYNRLGRGRDAVAVLRHGIEAAPEDDRLRFRLGLLYLSGESYDEALEELLAVEAPGDFPDLARLYDGIGLAYQNKGRENEALEYYRKLLTVDADEKGAYRLRIAFLMIKTNRVEEALGVLDGVWIERIDDVRIAHTLAVTYARFEKFPRAQAAFEKTLTFPGHPANVLFNYAVMKSEAGDPAAALSLMRAFLDRSSPDDPLRRTAEELAAAWTK